MDEHQRAEEIMKDNKINLQKEHISALEEYKNHFREKARNAEDHFIGKMKELNKQTEKRMSDVKREIKNIEEQIESKSKKLIKLSTIENQIEKKEHDLSNNILY